MCLQIINPMKAFQDSRLSRASMDTHSTHPDQDRQNRSDRYVGIGNPFALKTLSHQLCSFLGIGFRRTGVGYRRVVTTLFLIFIVASCLLLRSGTYDDYVPEPDTPEDFLRLSNLTAYSPPECNCPLVEHRFSQYFDSAAIKAFRKNYCEHSPFNADWPSYDFVEANSNSGFGSIVNNILNVYLLARDPSVNRTFSVYLPNWIHRRWTYYFSDFTEKCDHRIFQEGTELRNREFVNERGLKFSMSLGGHLLMNAPKHAFFHVGFESEFDPFWSAMNLLMQRDGWLSVFRCKSEMVKAMWNLQEPIKNVSKLFYSLLDSGNYSAIHIRRGDKLINEAEFIPEQAYLDKLKEVCRTRYCSRHVFVISDDVAAVHMISDMLGAEGWIVWSMVDLVNAAKLPADFLLEKEAGGYDFMAIKKWKLPEMYKHTREVVISLTLLATSSRVICTISSNFCRLSMILRGEELMDTTYSMDNVMNESLWVPF